MTKSNPLEPSETEPMQLLDRARTGDKEALRKLLGLYQNYLHLQAGAQLGTVLKLKLDPSDLVQETLLEAFRDFSQFGGHTEAELVGWLRRILVRNLADQARHHQAQARDHQRQESLEVSLERSSHAVHAALVASITSPSGRAAKREHAVILSDALAQLPEDYRQVIMLRHLEHLKFEEIAERMQRAPGAVRMLWMRAMEKLRELLNALS